MHTILNALAAYTNSSTALGVTALTIVPAPIAIVLWVLTRRPN